MTPLKMIFRWACVAALLSASLGAIRFSWAQAGSDNSPSASERRPSPPSCESCPQPSYPEEAIKEKIPTATVLLDVKILADGQTDDIRVVSDPGHGFADRAVNAVKKWKFKPATNKDGKPVSARTKIEVTFHALPRK
jgi:TonB family protein